MRSYEAARGLFSFLAICSWAIIFVGGIIALAAGAALSSAIGGNPSVMKLLFALLPGAGISLVGLYGLAMVQMARAGVDGAEYAQQSLGVARQQLEVSREALTQGKQLAVSYAALKPLEAVGNDDPSQADIMTSRGDEAPSFANRPGDSAPPSDRAITPEVTAELPEPALQETVENLQASTAATELAAVNDEAATAPGEHIDGEWRVGDRRFQTEAHARSFASQLRTGKNGKLT